MTKEEHIINRAIMTAKNLRAEARFQENRFGRLLVASEMRTGASAIEDLVGLLQKRGEEVKNT